jgi:cytochrome c oxidase assembly factor CtaG
LALAVPLSRFPSRVGGGSAFYVRPLHTITMKTKTKYTIVWTVLFFLGTLFGYWVFGSIVRERHDMPQWGRLYFFLPFTPLMMAGLALLMSRFGWLPGTKSNDRNAA